jgi:hypothetical protein
MDNHYYGVLAKDHFPSSPHPPKNDYFPCVYQKKKTNFPMEKMPKNKSLRLEVSRYWWE